MIKRAEKKYSYVLGYKVRKNAIIVVIVRIILTITLSVEAIRDPTVKLLIKTFKTVLINII